MPPMTAPVDGLGVICLFSSFRTEEEKKKREKFFQASFNFHRTLWALGCWCFCQICIFFVFCCCSEKESGAFHY